VAVADSRYQVRIVEDQEFSWLLSDIDDYNLRSKEKKVSLLESVGRQKMAEVETKRAERKAKRNSLDSVWSDENVLVEASIAVTSIVDGSDESVDADAVGDDDMGDDEEESRPDFLLLETARIVADIAELESNQELLERRFSQLNAAAGKHQKIN